LDAQKLFIVERCALTLGEKIETRQYSGQGIEIYFHPVVFKESFA
jgi:hypothetical protein